MTINHNVLIEIEYVNGAFLLQAEVSSIGRAMRMPPRAIHPTLGGALAAAQLFYDDSMEKLMQYHNPAPAPVAEKAPEAKPAKATRKTAKEPRRRFASA